MTQTILDWAVFGSGLAVFVISLWWWVDIRADLVVVRKATGKESVKEGAEGAVRLSWVRLVAGIAWFAIGMLVVMNQRPTNTAYLGRIVLLVLQWLHMTGLLFDRWTRMQVDAAIIDELEAKRVEIMTIAAKVEEKHEIVMQAIAENAKKTDGAAAAAREAYTEANHVNQKIEDLNARLLKQANELDAQQKRESISTAENKTTVEKIETNTAEAAVTLKSIDEKS